MIFGLLEAKRAIPRMRQVGIDRRDSVLRIARAERGDDRQVLFHRGTEHVFVEHHAIQTDQTDAEAVDAIEARDDLVAERVDHRLGAEASAHPFAQRLRRVRLQIARHAAGHDRVHKIAMAGPGMIYTQYILFEARALRQREGQPRIIADESEIAEMIGDMAVKSFDLAA